MITTIDQIVQLTLFWKWELQYNLLMFPEIEEYSIRSKTNVSNGRLMALFIESRLRITYTYFQILEESCSIMGMYLGQCMLVCTFTLAYIGFK